MIWAQCEIELAVGAVVDRRDGRLFLRQSLVFKNAHHMNYIDNISLNMSFAVGSCLHYLRA